ncbi:ThiF family adenylyltransferase [Oceanithermus sp.]
MNSVERKRFLRLKPGLGIGRDGQGLLYATYFVTGKTRVYEAPAWVKRLLAASVRGIPEEKALELVGGEAGVSPKEFEGVLDYLYREGIILRLTLAEVRRINRGRYGRQIEYFYEFASGSTPFTYQDRLASSSVVLLGLGGVGAWIALLLALTGVGSLTLVDGGTVRESNLSRQPLYREDQLGLRKVEAARESLLSLSIRV